jgi:hypothetical protein
MRKHRREVKGTQWVGTREWFVVFNAHPVLHRCDLLTSLGPLHLAQAPSVLALAGDDKGIRRGVTAT